MVVEIFGVRPKVDIAFTSPSMYGGTPAAYMQGCPALDLRTQQWSVLLLMTIDNTLEGWSSPLHQKNTDAKENKKCSFLGVHNHS